MTSIFNSNLPLSIFTKNWKAFFLWGLILVSLGLAAISAATFTTLLSVIFIGFILFISGLVIIIDTFTFWWKKWEGFFLHLLMGVLYTTIGLMLMNTPILGSISITLLLGVFYILLGLSRLMYSSLLRTPKWGWSFFNGLLSLLLGVLIITNLPSAALYLIGLFVGIDLLFCGFGYLMLAMAAKSVKARA